MPLVLSVCAALLVLSLVAIGGFSAVHAAGGPTPEPPGEGAIDSAMGLSEVLFGRYLLAFEASSVLLLAAAVAVLVLAKRERRSPSPEERA
jgi:NADH-quinone oxidoreductase subunit J